MKGFILILTIVMADGDAPGGAAIEVPPVVFATMADCQAAADAYMLADGSWNNHRAVCIGRGATVAAARW